jgi:5-methylcytosine-specific restriction enzyme A
MEYIYNYCFMGYDRYNKKSARNKKAFPGYFVNDESGLAREKEKSRKLRDTSWWRKKCAAGICTYCGIKVNPADLTMDHVIPLSRGGTSERFNIVPACKDCNNKKKYLLPAEWEEYLDGMNKKTE